jgi:hypothetical protein
MLVYVESWRAKKFPAEIELDKKIFEQKKSHSEIRIHKILTKKGRYAKKKKLRVKMVVEEKKDVWVVLVPNPNPNSSCRCQCENGRWTSREGLYNLLENCGLIFTSGLIFTIFSKFFVALYLGHIKPKTDHPYAFRDQLVELYLYSPNSKCFGQVSKNRKNLKSS